MLLYCKVDKLGSCSCTLNAVTVKADSFASNVALAGDACDTVGPFLVGESCWLW